MRLAARISSCLLGLAVNATVVVGASATECPPTPGEATVTLPQVMRNFGRFMVPAERAVQRGLRAPTDVSDQQLSDGIAGLDVVTACANAVLDDATEALLPPKAGTLTGEERLAYIRLYYDAMRSFRTTVQAFADGLNELLATPMDARDFTDAKQRLDTAYAAATHAHEILQ